MNILAVFIGGGLGSLARYGISRLVQMNTKTVFPVGTLVANVLSCIVVALVLNYLLEKQLMHSAWRLLLVVGFCGGFSTFSTFSYETWELIRSGNMLYAGLNVVVSLVACIVLIVLLSKRVV